jgi:hypothetical protein
MIEIPFNNAVYKEIDITKIENITQIDSSNLSILMKQNQYLFNSYKVAKLTDSLCVEGFVFIKVDKTGSFFVHCWNKIDNDYFDLTKDSVWSENGKEIECHYFPVDEYLFENYNVSENEINQELKFLSKTQEIVDGLQAEINEYYNQDYGQNKC